MGRPPPGRPRGRVWLSAWILAWSMGSLACQETVALGTECPPIGDTCIRPGNGSKLDGGMGPPNDGVGLAPMLDGGEPAAEIEGGPLEPLDASLDGGPEREDLPKLQNPSFELTSGTGGDVASFGGTAISPWYTCRGGLSAFQQADSRNTPIGPATPDQIIKPQDGMSFVSVSYPFGPPALLQRLAEPLKKGQRYAFAIDVRSATDGRDNLTLEVHGTNSPCLSSTKLVSSRAIKDSEGWVTICMSFMPGADFDELALQASIESGSINVSAGSRLFFDHLRSEPDCL